MGESTKDLIDADCSAFKLEPVCAEQSSPLRDMVGKLQDEVAGILGPNPEPFDMKMFTDEI
jgi:hypothetical protein